MKEEGRAGRPRNNSHPVAPLPIVSPVYGILVMTTAVSTAWKSALIMLSWSSPLVVEHGGKAQAIIAATNYVRSYDNSKPDVCKKHCHKL